MDQNIIKQCKAAGGRIENDRCTFSKSKPKSKINLELEVGGVNLKQAALWTFIGSIGFAAVMGIMALLGVGWGETQIRVLASTGIVGGYGLLMIGTFALFARRSKWIVYLLSTCFSTITLTSLLILWELMGGETFVKFMGTIGILFGFGLIAIANNAIRNKQTWLTYIGWTFTGSAFLLVLNIIWETKLLYCVDAAANYCSFSEGYLKLMTSLIVLAVWGGHTALMFLINPKKEVVKKMQWAAVGLATLTALIIISLIMMEPKEWISLVRILGIVGILNVAATIITPVLNRTK